MLFRSETIREELYTVMWDDVGILRNAEGLARARAKLAGLRAALAATGTGASDLRYNLTWHDWLNLDSLITVSGAILEAADARRESRGAHFREDFPASEDPARSAFSRVRSIGSHEVASADRFDVAFQPVAFTRVRPGQSLIAA